MKKVIIGSTLLLLAVCVAAPVAWAREWKLYDSPRYGYSLRIPAEFILQEEGRTTTWVYQPPQVTPVPTEEERRRININLGPINVQLDDPNDRRGRDRGRGRPAPPPPPEPPIVISVTAEWTPQQPSRTHFNAARNVDEQEANSPTPAITGIQDFSLGQGYSYEGDTYWFREVDKRTPLDPHRWVVRSFGNWSTYTIEITGAHVQYRDWGPVFEEVIRSWRLMPMDRPR